MGYFGKVKEKKIAIKLRQKGYSYSQIKEVVNVSKSTLSKWCRNIILSPNQLENLQKRKLSGAEKGRLIGAKKNQKLKKIRNKKIRKKALKQLGDISKRDKFVAGIGLYLGDGLKGDMEIGFANSNPKIIKFMMDWFRQFCKIEESKFRGQIWIHDNLDKDKALNYWSKTTNIPKKQFYKTYISENKTNSKKIRKQLHQYGVFSIRIIDSKIQRKILTWSAGILD